jgi:hydrogenase maturation protease
VNRELAEKVADAVLYEGYMLYPYRPSAIKNRQRWTFGTVYPPAYEEVGRGTESARMHTECRLTVKDGASLNIRLRFLHLLARQVLNAAGEPVPSLNFDGRVLESWDEGVSRAVEFDMTELSTAPFCGSFDFPSQHEMEPLRDAQGNLIGSVSRTQHAVNGTVTCSAERVRDDVFKLTIDVTNETVMISNPVDRNEALLRSFLSTHTIVSAQNADFISSMDPPEQLRDLAVSCKNVGNFPVLVGEQGARDTLLCSPIILYDYPEIAPESAGNFYDSTEIDEMLTLRVMTLTNEEKNEMRGADERVRNLLQRTEESAREQLMKTHGTIRSLRPVSENHD